MGYLGSEVVGVTPLRGNEAGAEDNFGHVEGDHHPLHSLPHGLLGAHGDVETPTGSTLKEVDVLLHIHRDGYLAGEQR